MTPFETALFGLTDTLSNNKEKALIFKVAGRVYHAMGNYEAAINCYNESLNCGELEYEDSENGEIYRLLGQAEHTMKRHEQSLEAYLLAIDYYKEENTEGKALSLFNLALLYEDQKQLLKAVAYYQQAADIYSHLQQWDSWAKSKLSRGKIFVAAGEVENAQKEFQELISFPERISNFIRKQILSSWLETL